MTESTDQSGAKDEFSPALQPAQLGALIAVVIATFILWWVARRDRAT